MPILSNRLMHGVLALILTTSLAHAADDLHLLTLGDWGIDSPERAEVGAEMGKFASKNGNHPAAVLLLGDNFYVKLSGVDDPRIQTFFEKTYDDKNLNIPFYAVMGNHDYSTGDMPVEMEYASSKNTRLKIPSRWYRLDLPAEKPVATILMLDSCAPPTLMKQEDWDEEMAWLKSELAKPHAPWLVCCAHHDIFGNGSHGDNGVLMTTWGPLFKQAKVDFYVCGHEHTLQHLELPGWPISFVVAGGGGAKTKPMLKDQRGPFSSSTYGFASFRFTPEKASVELINGNGHLLHAFTRDRNGAIKITANTPSDPATKKPLQTIQGIDDK
jgi:tartrate-resistant acid phosphatase type 5